MKIATWNVNGIRACLEKGLLDYIASEDPDIICLQETKAFKEQVKLETPGYFQYWSSAEKKGYSGTLILTKKEPLKSDYGGLDNEGRTVCLEYDNFYIVDNYVPNAQDGLARIDFRLDWEKKRLDYISDLDKNKPVIMCGDLNVAHKEIDLKNPGPNRGNAGFSDEERGAFQELLDKGFTDAYRYLYPDKADVYTWWSYRMKSRERNIGWRIDYFIVSDRIKESITDVKIRDDVYGSDHCPVVLDISISL